MDRIDILNMFISNHKETDFRIRLSEAIEVAKLALNNFSVAESYNQCLYHDLPKTSMKGTLCRKCYFKKYFQNKKSNEKTKKNKSYEAS